MAPIAAIIAGIAGTLACLWSAIMSDPSGASLMATYMTTAAATFAFIVAVSACRRMDLSDPRDLALRMPG